MLNESVMYPYDVYHPNRWGSMVCALIVYGCLIIHLYYLIQWKCRPRLLGIFLFLIPLIIFIEFILRSTLEKSLMDRKGIYLLRFALINAPFRLLLFSNYHYLIELREKGKIRLFDRLMDLFYPIVATAVDILAGISNEYSFNIHSREKSFLFRRIASIILISLSLFFNVLWYFSRSKIHHREIHLLLFISNTSVFIQSIYLCLLSNPSFYHRSSENEIYFYFGCVLPLIISLIFWNLFHPTKYLYSRSKPISNLQQQQQQEEHLI